MAFARRSTWTPCTWRRRSPTASGRFVRGLTREDFRVYEDDVLQPISAFAAENIPLEIIVAVDVSGSMQAAMPR